MNVEQVMEMSTEEALVSALTPKKVGDIELQPLGFMRHAAAIWLSRESKSELFNAVMTVWICTLSESEVMKVWEDSAQCQVNAWKWAETQGYTIFDYEPLMTIYTRLMRELRPSTSVKLKGGQDGDAPKNVGGQPRL